jgi:hypothetical protein
MNLENIEILEEGLGLEDKFPFGKYKGYRVGRIIETDISYANWWIVNVQNCPLSKKSLECFKKREQELDWYPRKKYKRSWSYGGWTQEDDIDFYSCFEWGSQ